MESQFGSEHAASRWLAWGEAVRLAGAAGVFRVEDGRVWLTREGDLDDHVLGAGESVTLRGGEAVVVEAWRRGEPTRVAWRPCTQRRRTPGLADERAAEGTPCAA